MKNRPEKTIEILKRLESEILVLDGAMGTQLHRRGLASSNCPEACNLDAGQAMVDIHSDYIRAGADIILSNTFGALGCRLKEYSLDNQLETIIAASADHCRTAINDCRKDGSDNGRRIYALGNVGPTGRFLPPVGNADWSQTLDEYARTMKAFNSAGFDGVIIETMAEIREMKCALMAARDHFDGLVIALMTFQDIDGTVTGTKPLAFVKLAERLGADIIGLNCTTGPDAFLPIVELMRKHTHLPIAVEPNAGLPSLIDGENVFPGKPSDFYAAAERFAALGANIIGGCCGSTPDFIREIRRATVGKKPVPRPAADSQTTWLTTSFDAFAFGLNRPAAVIGERINPSGRKAFKAALRAGDYKMVRSEAIAQATAGADILDVNMGVGDFDEMSAMKRAIRLVQDHTRSPLSIDTSFYDAAKIALEEYGGKALFNSISAEADKLERFAPLAAQHGAAMIALALDDSGIPDTVADRIRHIETILKTTDALGIPRCDILVDCLSLPVGAKPLQAKFTLDAMRIAKRDYGVKTALGVSNVSFGLPERVNVNNAFLTMAIEAGLDFAIVNPLSLPTMTAYHSASTLVGRDPNNARYVAAMTRPPETDAEAEAARLKAMPPLERLRHAIVNGDKDHAAELADGALRSGSDAFDISDKALLPALDIVGEKFARKEFFLPQVLLSADASRVVFDRIRDLLKSADGSRSGGVIVLATVQGDAHDIGKNIVGAIMENNGWTVHDLGKNVPSEFVVSEAVRLGADMVGVSALMTTTMERMREVVGEVVRQGFNGHVIVGGAVITSEYAKKIGADGYGSDAMTGLTTARDLLALGKKKRG